MGALPEVRVDWRGNISRHPLVSDDLHRGKLDEEGEWEETQILL